VRGRIQAPVDADDAELTRLALQNEAIAKAVAGRPVRKTIVAKGRLINLILA
jgi:leucyl-tRNA synthetase